MRVGDRGMAAVRKWILFNKAATPVGFQIYVWGTLGVSWKRAVRCEANGKGDRSLPLVPRLVSVGSDAHGSFGFRETWMGA